MSASPVSGPVARITGRASGMRVTSSVTTSMFAWPRIAREISSAKRSRSTASAPPAGTAVRSAERITSEPERRISSLSRPTAFDSEAPRSELEHTSSAR